MSNDIGDVHQQMADAAAPWVRRWEITYKWEAQKGPDGAVLINEHRSDQQGFTQWGPMPESVVEPFLLARKAELNITQERMANILESWNIGHLLPAADTQKAGG